MTKRDGESHYICSECAARYGAEWPAGHRGTAHPGDCDYCGHRDKMLTAITDWSWPARIDGEQGAGEEVMTDLVERLRDWADYEPAKMFCANMIKDADEAAAKIERLTAALRECLEAFEHYEKHGPGSIDLSGYPYGIKKLLGITDEQQARHDPRDDFSPENDPFRDYCEQCHGPCLRRPRHGEFNI